MTNANNERTQIEKLRRSVELALELMERVLDRADLRGDLGGAAILFDAQARLAGCRQHLLELEQRVEALNAARSSEAARRACRNLIRFPGLNQLQIEAPAARAIAPEAEGWRGAQSTLASHQRDRGFDLSAQTKTILPGEAVPTAYMEARTK